jgi:hypothetical protein
MPIMTRERLPYADTLPDEGHGGRNDQSLLRLALEAREKALGCARLCELASHAARSESLRLAFQRRRHHAEKRARAISRLAGGLAATKVDSLGLPGSVAARYRVKALARALDIAVASGDAELAERVASECVAQARLMADVTWRKLVTATRGTGAARLLRAPA